MDNENQMFLVLSYAQYSLFSRGGACTSQGLTRYKSCKRNSTALMSNICFSAFRENNVVSSKFPKDLRLDPWFYYIHGSLKRARRTTQLNKHSWRAVLLMEWRNDRHVMIGVVNLDLSTTAITTERGEYQCLPKGVDRLVHSWYRVRVA